MKLKITSTLLFMLTFVGCAQSEYHWRAKNKTNDMFHRDSAQCKLMARNAANNITTPNNQSFTATTYNYGGVQDTRVDPDYMQDAVSNVITGLQQSVEESKVYELCMESKGYYNGNKPFERNFTSINHTGYNESKIGMPCSTQDGCGDINLLCSPYRQICIKVEQLEGEIKRFSKTNNLPKNNRYELSKKYYYGRSVPQSYAKAAELLKEAAEQGYAKAQYELGYRYDNGIGGPENYTKAVKWYKKAAEQGYARAQDALNRIKRKKIKKIAHHGCAVFEMYDQELSKCIPQSTWIDKYRNTPGAKEVLEREEQIR